MIVDAHAHVVEEIRGRSGVGLIRPLGYGRMQRGEHAVPPREVIQLLPPFRSDTDFPVDVLLAFMDWQRVDRAVLLQGDFYGAANEYVARAVKDHRVP